MRVIIFILLGIVLEILVRRFSCIKLLKERLKTKRQEKQYRQLIMLKMDIIEAVASYNYYQVMKRGLSNTQQLHTEDQLIDITDLLFSKNKKQYKHKDLFKHDDVYKLIKPYIGEVKKRTKKEKFKYYDKINNISGIFESVDQLPDIDFDQFNNSDNHVDTNNESDLVKFFKYH